MGRAARQVGLDRQLHQVRMDDGNIKREGDGLIEDVVLRSVQEDGVVMVGVD